MPDPTRPKYDPRLSPQRVSMLDSLMTIMGHAPDSINVTPSTLWRGETRGNVVRVRDPNDVNTLLHELGHFWSMRESPSSYALSDSLHTNPASIAGNERLANAYGALLQARNDTTQTSNTDAKLLYRILRRAAGGQR